MCTEREREEIHLLSCYFTLQISTKPGFTRAEAKIPEHHLGVPHGGKGSKHIIFCLPEFIFRQLDQKQYCQI